MIDLSFPTVKLGQHIRKINTRVKDSNFDSSDIIVYGVTNIDGITVTGQKVSEDIGDYILLQKNQFAFNPYRINVGSLGLFQDDNIGAVSPAYVVFEALLSYDSDFLLFYLKSPLGIKLIKWYGDRGGVRAALRFDDLCNIDVPDISVENQRIFMQNFSVIKTNLNEYNRQLDKQTLYISKLRQSILQQAVEGKLCPQDPNDEPASELLKKIKVEKEQLVKDGKIKKEKPLPPIKENEKPFELPQGWEWCRIGQISEIYSGSTPDTHNPLYYQNGTIPWITSTMTSFSVINFSQTYVTEKAVKDCSLRVFDKGTLIMAMYGQGKTRGQISELNISATINQACASIVPYDMCLKEFIKIFCKKIYNEIRLLASGGAQPNLNQGKIRNFVIMLPPLQEQQRIVQKVDALMSYCDELEKQVSKSKENAENLMQSILAKAFNNQEMKKSAVIVAMPPQVKTQPVKLAARGSISAETMQHIEQTISEMCGES